MLFLDIRFSFLFLPDSVVSAPLIKNLFYYYFKKNFYLLPTPLVFSLCFNYPSLSVAPLIPFLLFIHAFFLFFLSFFLLFSFSFHFFPLSIPFLFSSFPLLFFLPLLFAPSHSHVNFFLSDFHFTIFSFFSSSSFVFCFLVSQFSFLLSLSVSLFFFLILPSLLFFIFYYF